MELFTLYMYVCILCREILSTTPTVRRNYLHLRAQILAAKYGHLLRGNICTQTHTHTHLYYYTVVLVALEVEEVLEDM